MIIYKSYDNSPKEAHFSELLGANSSARVMKITVEQLPAEAEYEMDDATLASELLYMIKDQPGFADTFSMAADSDLKILFDRTPMDMREAISDAANMSISEAFGGCAVCIVLPPKTAGKEQIKLLSADGAALAALDVPSPCTFQDVADVLSEKLEGADLTLTKIAAPAKIGLVRYTLMDFVASTEVVKGVADKVMVLPPFKRPPAPPEALSQLQLELPPGAQERTTEPGGIEAGPDGTDGDAAKYQADALAACQHTIATSKSGGNSPEGRTWMSKLSAGLLNFAATNPASDKQSRHGWYTCTLCTVTNQIDSAHGGTLRHVGGVGHVKKWLAVYPAGTTTAVEVRAFLPRVWGGARIEATTQFKVAQVKRQQKARLDQVIAGVAAVGSPVPQANAAPTTPETVTAATVMGAATAAAANLAAM